MIRADKVDKMVTDFLDTTGNDPEAWEIREFLDSLTTEDPSETIKRLTIMIGKRKPTELIPEPLFHFLNKFQRTSNHPYMNALRHATQMWKMVTLNWVFSAYHLGNIGGDIRNAIILGDPRVAKFMPIVWRIRNALTKGAQYNPKAIRQAFEGQQVKLNADEQEALQIIDEQDVLGGSGLMDLGIQAEQGLKAGMTRAQYLLNKFNFRREAVARVALVLQKLDEYKRTGKITSITFMDDIKGLTPHEAIGFIGRTAPVDYLFATNVFRDTINGIMFPFSTFPVKNLINYGRYARNAFKQTIGHEPYIDTQTGALTINMGKIRPAQEIMGTRRGKPNPLALLQPLTLIAAPVTTAIAINHSTEDRRYAYKYLGPLKDNPYTTILKTYKDIDGQPPTRALVWSPVTPDFLAMNALQLGRITTYIDSVKKGIMTPKEAGIAYAKDISYGIPKLFLRLQNPAMKAILAMVYNKDLYTGGKIYPEGEGLDFTDKADYIAGYVVKSLLTPVAQYVYESYGGGSQLQLSEYSKDMVRRATIWAEKAQGRIKEGQFPIEGGETTDWLRDTKGPFGFIRGMGFYEVNLVKNRYVELETVNERKHGKYLQTVRELNSALVSSFIDEKPSPDIFINALNEKIQSGEVAPEQVTIDGISITENPQGYYEKLKTDLKRMFDSDRSVKQLVNSYKQTAKSYEEKKQIEVMFEMSRMSKMIDKIKNMPEGEQLNILQPLLEQYDYNEKEGDY